MTEATWRNWGRTVESTPTESVFPTTTAEIARIVQRAADSGTSLKTVGAGHSFSACAATEGIQLSLDNLAGVKAVTPVYGPDGEPAGADVTLWAGTRLRDAGPLLWELGLAQENLGDIDEQSIAGSISTGTHGTGAGFGSIHTTVTALQIVTGTGDILDCDAQRNPELFAAARVSLGALGVLSCVTVRCVPAFALESTERPSTLDEVTGDLEGFLRDGDHVEFFWFPHTDLIEVKQNTRIPASSELRPKSAFALKRGELLTNNAFGMLCRTVARRPGLTKHANAISGRLMGKSTYSDRSYKVFSSTRNVRFREIEYGVPIADAAEVLAELRSFFDAAEFPTPFPIEVRAVRADDAPLSSAHGRDSVYFSVHQYVGMDAEPIFDHVESVFRAAGGRPHWGKMHSLTADELSRLYPRYDDFVAVRDSVDPERVFRNEYTEKVLPA